MSDIFLSYNREDQERAKAFAEGFERQGFTVWWDVGLRTGEAYDQVTEKALREAKAVVVLWSKRSVESRWVRAEATLADRNKTLLPCMIEACERPIMFELTQTAELGHWQGAADDRAWLAFLADLQRLIAKNAAAAPEPAPAQRAMKPDQSGGAASLAVLPFANRSGVPEDEVFADGMVEDVIAALSQGVNVRVLASAATTHLRRGGPVDIAAIGRQLGVRYLLEGNVRRTGDRLRVTTQVVEASTSSVLWAGSFQRPLSELAALQEDLVVEVAATLEIKVQTLELQRTLKKPGDLTAWEAMVRAFAFERQGDPASLMRAIEEAQRSVNIAPDYAVAHSALAQTSGVLYLIASPDDPVTVQRIRGHVDRALTLDSEDVFVLGNCSQALNYIGNPQDALVQATRAVRKAPNLGPLHYGLGVTYCLLNRPEEALRCLDDSDRLMPGWTFLYFLKGWKATAFIRAGRWDDAEAMADDALALNPDYDGARVVKAMACRLSQRHVDARNVLAPVTSRGLPLEQVLIFNRRVYAGCGMQEEILHGIRALWTEIAGEAQNAE